MPNPNLSKSVLSKSNSVAILIYLYENEGHSKATFIQQSVGLNYDSLKNSAQRLADTGLVTIEDVPGKSRYILYTLTPLGWSVAADLKRANDRLNGIEHESACDVISSSSTIGDKTSQ